MRVDEEIRPMLKGYEALNLIEAHREGNHVWFVYKHIGQLYKTTLSWFPHLGYIHADRETHAVVKQKKKVVVYE